MVSGIFLNRTRKPNQDPRASDDQHKEHSMCDARF